MRLGWRPPDNKFGRFDILPLVLQANGKDPEFFIIPEDLILEVHLTHPELVVIVASYFVSMLLNLFFAFYMLIGRGLSLKFSFALARDLL